MTSTDTLQHPAPAAPARDPNRRLSETTGPTAARRAIKRGTLSPTLQRLAEAYIAADDAYQAPARAHSAAESAVFAARRDRQSPPIPDALTFHTPASTYACEGKTYPIGPTPFTLTTRKDILAHFKGDKAAAAPALAALAKFQKQQAEIDEASGLAALMRRENETQELAVEASDALHAAWMAALRHPTVCLADVAVKEAMIAQSLRMDEFAPVAAALGATLNAIRTGQVCPPDPEIARAWNEAMARYREAQAAVAFQSEVSRLLYLKAEIPECLRAPSLHYSVACRWQDEEQLIDDLLVTPEAKAELLQILREHLAKPESLLRPACPEDEAAIEADEEATQLLDGALWEAEKALLDTPAPDVAAMAWKAAMTARESDGDKFGFADLGLVAYHASDCAFPERGRVAQYLDLLRLCDPNSPLLHMPAFSPHAWIDAYEDLGGVVSLTPTGMIIVFPAEDTPGAAALRDELADMPWKYRALWHRAEHRAVQGGDPYFDFCGRYLDSRAQRAPRFLSPSQPADRALHVAFVTIDGAPVPVVEEVVNDPA